MVNNHKIAFFGTPDFAVQILEELKNGGITPDLIITNPDEPQGRKLIVTPPPVKLWAKKNNISIIQPENLKATPLELTRGFDLFLVVAYGKIIPETILNLPTCGTLNVHPSLLPLYRGPSPMQYTILNGDKEAGISIMLLDKEMDHGPIIAQKSYDISGSDPYIADLRKILALEASKILIDVIPKWITNEIKATPQDHTRATFTKKIDKEDGFIESNIIIESSSDKKELGLKSWRKIRAFNPDPGTYTILEHKGKKIRLKITRARMEGDQILIEKIIPEGKKEMFWEDWKRGNLK